MGRRVVYIIVEETDDREGTELTFKIDNSAQAIQLKGGAESFKIAGTDSNNADTIQPKGGEELEIDNPANQEAISKMVQVERDTPQTRPTSGYNDEPIQPQPFAKRLVSYLRSLTWETVKTIFKTTIATVVRFLLRVFLGLPF